MLIAHVTATFPPYQGGTGNVCYHNALELSRRGHQVTVFTAAVPGAPEREAVEGVRVHRLNPLLRFGNASLIGQFNSVLQNQDLIHFHYPFFGGELAAWTAKQRDIPLVITYHQDVLLSGLPGLLERLLRQTLSRWVLRSAKKVLFTSLDYSRESHSRSLLRGRETAIGEQPNGVDADFFTPGETPPDLRQRLGLQGQEQVLLLVASLDRAHYFKGVPVLLQALTDLPEAVHAVIVGDGDLRASYHQQAQTLSLAGRVHFAGRVSQPELPGYYRLADLVVLPSITMGEAFGLVLIEAFACGIPVVASRLPGVRSVVTEGVDGLLANVGDAGDLSGKLHTLLNMSSEQRRAMGAAGRQKVEQRFTWPCLAEQLEQVYFECLGRSA